MISATPALLAEVDDHAPFLALYVFQARFELLPAVAAERKPNVSGMTLRVDPDRASIYPFNVAVDHCGVLFSIAMIQKTVDREDPKAGGKLGFAD